MCQRGGLAGWPSVLGLPACAGLVRDYWGPDSACVASTVLSPPVKCLSQEGDLLRMSAMQAGVKCGSELV